jgi:hypothetical protein
MHRIIQTKMVQLGTTRQQKGSGRKREVKIVRRRKRRETFHPLA